MTVLMGVGKNLNGLDLKYDYQGLCTKCYLRGSGSGDSEMGLDNPQYWPAEQNIVLDHETAGAAYFRLPNPYSVYNGFTGDGQHLPPGFAVYKDTYNVYDLSTGLHMPSKPLEAMPPAVAIPSSGVAQMFYMSGTWAISSVSLYLQRMLSDDSANPPPQWTTQPRFIVAMYSAIGSLALPGFQSAGLHVPYQGPQTWCYGNLLSIDSSAPAWYEFPLQVQPNTWTGWVAIVIMPYPTSNKQWGYTDYLGVGESKSLQGTSTNSYALQEINGVSQKNWAMGWTLDDVTKPYGDQLAIKIRGVETNVTSSFYQAYNDYPGRFIMSPQNQQETIAPNGWSAYQWVFHYQHAPYIVNWPAYEQYGKWEGTFKDDSLTTQAALLAAGSQHLTTVSQPVETISLSAVDLYDLDPTTYADDELTYGGTVRIIDDVLGIDETCIITKIAKTDLTQPHVIDTLTLNNVHLSASKLMAQLSKNAQRYPKYVPGATVETPYTTTGSVSSDSPAEMTFYIRDATTLTHSVRLTIDTPGAFQVYVDGNAVNGGAGYSGMNEIDVMDALTKAHNGQPTPGVHTVEVHSST